MAIICLELICLALIVSSVFTTATIGMMTGRIEQLEEDINKLNENNRIEVENDGWN